MNWCNSIARQNCFALNFIGRKSCIFLSRRKKNTPKTISDKIPSRCDKHCHTKHSDIFVQRYRKDTSYDGQPRLCNACKNKYKQLDFVYIFVVRVLTSIHWYLLSGTLRNRQWVREWVEKNDLWTTASHTQTSNKFKKSIYITWKKHEIEFEEKRSNAENERGTHTMDEYMKTNTNNHK